MRCAVAVVVALLGSVLTARWPAPELGPGLLVLWGLVVLLLRPTANSRRSLALAAILVRLPLLAAPPRWSDDVWRYLWEGEVWRAGFNPFTLPPDHPDLVPLRDAVWAQVNHREVSSIYPPLAQLLFVLLPATPWVWKLVMGAADVGTATLLHRRDPGAGWLWALLPLPALESAGSGHLEGIGLFLTTLALGGSHAAAWAGAMVKLLPGVLLVRTSARVWLGALLATILVVLPIAGPHLERGFQTYREVWAFNGSLHPLLGLLGTEPTTRRVLESAGILVVVGILARSQDRGRIAVWTFGAFVLLSPTVHPWYVLWPLLASLWNRQRAWVVLAVTVPLAYQVLGSYDPATSSWHEAWWPRWVLYPPFYLALLLEAWRRFSRPGPAPVG